jgi:plastocyanin
MLFTSNIKSLALSSLVLAALPAVLGAEFNVTVGGTGASALKFDPETINAQPGDIVRFVFKQKNHTATQSTFGNPCTKADGGFDSGFVPVGAEVTSNFPLAELPITNTNPIWVYCKQGNHCQQGMVFSINPGSAQKFADFKAAATGAAPASSSSTSSTATSSAPSTSSTSTPTGSGTDHKVLVGASGLTFEPQTVSAKAGDTITFEFRAKNHTVTASSFAAPCVPLSETSTLESFFDSGYQPVAAGTTSFPTFTIKVNDSTTPIWAYCKQGNHCGSGMVFAANTDETGPRNFAAFLDLAKQLNGTGSTTTGGNNSGASHQVVSLRSAGAAIAALAISAFLL